MTGTTGWETPRRHFLRAEPFTCIPSHWVIAPLEMGGSHQFHFTGKEMDTDQGTRKASLRGLGLPAAFSQWETQAGEVHFGVQRGHVPLLGHSSGLPAPLPRLQVISASGNFTVAYSFRSRNGNCSLPSPALGRGPFAILC